MRSLLLKFGLAAALMFLPIKANLGAVAALVAIDLVSGLIAAKKRGEAITSTGLKRTVVKILAYELVVLMGFVVEQWLTGDLIPVVKLLSGMIGITELKSVLENLESITGLPLIKMLIDKLSQAENNTP